VRHAIVGATLLTVDLAAETWPTAFKMPKKPPGVYKMQENAGLKRVGC